MTAELEHGTRLTTEEARVLINELGVERMTLTPASLDFFLRDRSTIAVYFAGVHRREIRYERWHGDDATQGAMQ